MSEVLNVRHIYEHDGERFEERLNEVITRIVKEGGVIGDIKYASDAATPENPRGGFGALVIWERNGTDSSS